MTKKEKRETAQIIGKSLQHRSLSPVLKSILWQCIKKHGPEILKGFREGGVDLKQ